MRCLVLRLVRLALALAPAFAGAAPPVVVDDFGNRVSLQGRAERIVSMAPGATEMLFAAGAGERIVATVEFSEHPPAARRLPRIGDANAVDLERLVALRPDVVVVWPGGNNAAQIAQIERLGLPLYRHRLDSFAELPAALRRLGELAGTQPQAERAAAAIAARLARLESRYATRERVSVLLEVWNRPLYTVGGAQLMSDALRICGARNVFGDLAELAPAVDLEAVVARDPDVIVAVAPPGRSAHDWVEEWKRFGSLRAVRSGRLVPFEGEALTRLGPSVVDATEALCEAIDAVRPASRAADGGGAPRIHP